MSNVANEYRCFDVNGHYTGEAFDLWVAAEKSGEGGEIILEMRVGEKVWTVRDGLTYGPVYRQ
jgi:hypothetical protein